MTQCRFCKSDIPSDATRCPHCTSFLDGEQPQGSSGQITYIVDKGLVTFAKFAGAVLAIFLSLTLSFYGFDIKQVRKEIEDTHVESQKLALDIKQAKGDLARETTEIQKERADIQNKMADIKKDVEAAEEAAKVAITTSSRAKSLLEEAEQSKQRIHQYEITLLAPTLGSKPPSSAQSSQPGLDPAQVDRLVDARLLEALKSVLPSKQYSALQTKIAATQTAGVRRQVFDAKNTSVYPGELVRSEGDAPIADRAANEVYDNLEVVHRFFKEVFGWEIPDNKGKTLVVTIHYGEEYDNGFWDPTRKQIVFGDGDGKLFRKGGFSSLSFLAAYISYYVNEWMAQLKYGEGQSGALLVSFAEVMGCLVEQWQKHQTTDEASWLFGADIFAPGVKARALHDLAHPGTAYDDPNLGKDPDWGHMKDGINTGVLNKAFFELSNKLKGYAWEKPGKIWFESYRTLKPKSTFQDLAKATLDVTKKTYGERSPESEAVIESLAAVGITVGSGTQK
jgi:Zn-dependent metalloprotease